MDWLDYREKLGVGFFDSDKTQYFYTKIFNVLNAVSNDSSSECMDSEEYFDFCNLTGTIFDISIYNEYHCTQRMCACIDILECHTKSLTDFLAYYIAFTNSIKIEKSEYHPHAWNRKSFITLLKNMLSQSHIAFDVLQDCDEYFVFPKGVPELDDALVSQPLEWLKDYPSAQKTYIITLKQYSEGIYIRDVADNLRKTLEAFLQEFLGNTKNLETNKNEICKYLGEQGVDAGISGLFQPLINSYKNINDRIAKHNDAVDKNLLEFLLYQTGVLIRMVISIKNVEV